MKTLLCCVEFGAFSGIQNKVSVLKTTNQFGNICVKSGYDGNPQYKGLNDGGSYSNAGDINLGGINADKSGKYPTVLRSDPKPYNGIMSLF